MHLASDASPFSSPARKVIYMSEGFKARMRRIRLRAGYKSQADAAQAIGCERGTVSMWEAPSSAVNKVGQEYLFQVARAYCVAADWINRGGPNDGWHESTTRVSGPSKESEPHVGGYLDPTRRKQIYSRLLGEIKKTERQPADVALRLGMTEKDFLERAEHGDLTLEDLAEAIVFLGEGVSMDWIVLGRFPKADMSVGDIGHVMEGVKARAKVTRRN